MSDEPLFFLATETTKNNHRSAHDELFNQFSAKSSQRRHFFRRNRGTLSLQGGQVAEWVWNISSAVGVRMELLDQAPQLPHDSRDTLGRDDMDCRTHSYSTCFTFFSQTVALRGLPTRIAQVSILFSPPRNAIVLDDLVDKSLLRRPRCRWPSTRNPSLRHGGAVERLHIPDQA